MGPNADLNLLVLMPDGTHAEIDISIGIAEFPEDATDVDALLHTADKRMYEEKGSRR